MAAVAALAPLSAAAQVSCAPVYGGGSQCTDINGAITPASSDSAAGRASPRTDPASAVAPAYSGYPLTPPASAAPAQAASDGRESRANDRAESLGAATPNFDSYFAAGGRPAASPNAPPPPGSYRTTDATGKVLTCVPVDGGGYRCT